MYRTKQVLSCKSCHFLAFKSLFWCNLPVILLPEYPLLWILDFCSAFFYFLYTQLLLFLWFFVIFLISSFFISYHHFFFNFLIPSPPCSYFFCWFSLILQFLNFLYALPRHWHFFFDFHLILFWILLWFSCSFLLTNAFSLVLLLVTFLCCFFFGFWEFLAVFMLCDFFLQCNVIWSWTTFD